MRAAYLERTDRGDALAGLRLLGPHTDDDWTAPADTPDDDFGPDVVAHARRCAGEGAIWLASSLNDGRNTLAALCVDVEGSICTWLDAPSRSPQVVSAAYSQIGGGESTALLASPELSAIEAMDGPVTDAAAPVTRLGVIATPDSIPRLLLDELDQRGVEAKRVLSIWQAISETWDPGGPASQLAPARGERLTKRDFVPGEAASTAIVLIEPRGRLLWVWSRGGRAVAAGSVRLATSDGAPVVTRNDAARLAADWLAWSPQCADAPTRALCITTDFGGENTNSNGSEASRALTPSEFGELMNEALPGASVQMTVEPDPIGETLARLCRLAEETDPIGEGITQLTRAPGRSHRSLYNWASIALLAGAIGVFAMAYRANDRVSDVRAAASAERERQDELLIDAGKPDMVGDPFAMLDLEEEVRKAAGARPTTGPDRPIRPVLPELEAVAFALGSVNGWLPEPIRLEAIKLNSLTANVEFWAPEASVAFQVKEEIDVFRNKLDWEAPQPTNTRERDGMSKFQVTGNWPKNEVGS